MPRDAPPTANAVEDLDACHIFFMVVLPCFFHVIVPEAVNKLGCKFVPVKGTQCLDHDMNHGE